MARFLASVIILALVAPALAGFSAPQPACCCGSRTCPMRMMACKAGFCSMHKAVEVLFPSLPPALIPAAMAINASFVTTFVTSMTHSRTASFLPPPDPPPPRLG